MKYIVLFAIRVYQQYGRMILRQGLGLEATCLYSPTCSVYAAAVIKKHGAIKGTYLAVRRLLSCQQFFKRSYGKSV